MAPAPGAVPPPARRGPDPISQPGFIYPGSATYVRCDADGRVTVGDLGDGATLTADGVLAEELRGAIEQRAPSARLAALGTEARQLVARVTALTRTPALPLTAAAAVALGGFEMLFVELTGQCNLTCAHCYAGSSPTVTAALERDTCEAILRDAVGLGFRRVQFTGGEPLLCAFLPELVAYARDLGIEQIEIFTNGTLLDADLLARLTPHAPDIAMSFYAGAPEVHDRVTGLPGSHTRTAAAIARVLAAGLSLRVAIVATGLNTDAVPAAIAYLEALGVKQIRSSGSYAVGRGAFVDRPAAVAAAPPEWRDPGEGQTQRGTLCVGYDGAVYPCIFNRSVPLGHISERSLAQIAAAPDAPASGDVPIDDAKRLACLNCRLTQSALRACGEV